MSATGLGPGSIVVDGRATTVSDELKDLGAGFEEAKADVMGAYQAMYMMDKGVLPKTDKPRMRASYIAGLFRAMLPAGEMWSVVIESPSTASARAPLMSTGGVVVIDSPSK